MPYVAIVTVLALLQFTFLGLKVGSARKKYGVPAPATSGNEMFERQYRVHANTLEQLVTMLPLMWVFANFISPLWAAGFGAVFIVGRAVYAVTYVRDPKSRSLGFALTAIPSLVMMIWTLIWAIRALSNNAA